MLLGQSVEYKIASMLLGEGREIYLPVVDDHGVDMLVAQSQSGTSSYQELQIKSVSKGGLFAAISCLNPVQTIGSFFMSKVLILYGL